MNDIVRGKDVGGASGAGNDGSFASKGQTAAEVELTPARKVGPALARFQAAEAARYDAERRELAAVEDAIREVALAEYPNAATAVYVWDDGEDQLSFHHLADAEGEEIDDSYVSDDLYSLGHTLDSYDYLRRDSGFTVDYEFVTLPLVVPKASVEEKIAAVNAELDSIAPAREALSVREGELAAAAITAIAREKHPDAAAVTLYDVSDEGSPYYHVARIEDASGETLWDYDDGEDDLADAFAEFSPVLDRIHDRLDEVGTRHNPVWKLTL